MPKPTRRLHEVRNGQSKPASATPDQEAIAARAYQLWLDRGCPDGTDQEDWYRAEQELRDAADKAA